MFERNLTTSRPHVSAGQIAFHLMRYLQSWNGRNSMWFSIATSLPLNNDFNVHLSIRLGSVENKTNMHKSGYTLVTLPRFRVSKHRKVASD
jgi:hypothetical protein